MSYRPNSNSGIIGDELLEQQNNLLQDQLANSVSQLKNVAKQIKIDVDDHNRYLDSMGDQFGSTQGLLTGTVNRVKWMMNSGGSNRKIMLWTTIALISLMFIIYYYFWL